MESGSQFPSVQTEVRTNPPSVKTRDVGTNGRGYELMYVSTFSEDATDDTRVDRKVPVQVTTQSDDGVGSWRRRRTDQRH